MQKNILIIIILFTFIGCNPSSRVNNNNDKTNIAKEPVFAGIEQNMADSSFIHSISKINTLELPLTLYCGAETYTWAEDLGDDILRIVPINYVVVGLLPINNDIVYVIYGNVGDIVYPYLYVYNKNGQLLDSMYLHINYCDGDEYEIHSTVTTIDNNYSIYMSDTSKYIHYNDRNELFIDSIIVGERELKLENDLFKIVKNIEQKID
jgi:hypothetical protein